MDAAKQVFALVDVNNMYVSCERAFNPKLHNRPIVVLSNNDGCVVSKSNEVKAMGVKTGTPWFQMQDLARQHGITALSSNYTLYGDMSNRIMSILRGYSPDVEVYSIDECFVSLNGMIPVWPTLNDMGQHMRARIAQWTSLPVCVGIGESKTLAKLGNHIAKKWVLFGGVCDLTTMSAERRHWLFSRTEAGEVWGVGRQLGGKLKAIGIETVQQLKDAPQHDIRRRFGVVMQRTHQELNGISCLAREDVSTPRKQIIASRSFGVMTRRIEDLTEAISQYVARAGEKLRGQASLCGAIHVFIQSNRYRQQDPQYSNGVTIPLVSPTDDNRVLASAAAQGLKLIYREGVEYKKAGVTLMDLSSNSVTQGDLFDPAPLSDKSQKAMAALDKINARFGQDAVFMASAGTTKHWKMLSGNRTPKYTTNWLELPVVSAK